MFSTTLLNCSGWSAYTWWEASLTSCTRTQRERESEGERERVAAAAPNSIINQFEVNDINLEQKAHFLKA